MSESLEEEFRRLDVREHAFLARALRSYYDALKEQEFSDKQAFELLKHYAKFLYDMALEELHAEQMEKTWGDDVDPPDDEEL